MIIDRLERIRERIEAACARVGKKASEVILVAVSKGRGIDDIKEALGAGIQHIGESRVQEAREKFLQLSTLDSRHTTITWHLIGHLQTNKVRQAVGMFGLIQSVDSLRLAEAIDCEAGRIGKVQDILLEVKTSPEVSKFGLKPEETQAVLEKMKFFQNISVKGLMTIAPYSDDPEASRPYFRQLRELRDGLNARHTTHDSRFELSMGMTDDFEVALEEGATMVRIGRAIFE